MKMFLFLRCVSRKELGWIETKELRSQEQRGVAAGTKGRETRGLGEEEQGPRIYMPAEKAEDLMSKNEEVRRLVVDLGLDIK